VRDLQQRFDGLEARLGAIEGRFGAMERRFAVQEERMSRMLSLIVNGFCRDVLKELPMEFAVEAQKLLAVSLEGSVG